MHQTALEAVHCRPISITRIVCHRLLSSFFLFSWHNLGLAGRNAQKQVFSYGGTTENLKNALSTLPNQLLQRCNGHSARCNGGLKSQKIPFRPSEWSSNFENNPFRPSEWASNFENNPSHASEHVLIHATRLRTRRNT